MRRWPTRKRALIACYALLAAGAGCSSTGSASSDARGGAGGSAGAGAIDAGADDRGSDASPEVSPVGVDDVDGTPCPPSVTCASGLCGAGGLCLPKYVWSRPLPQGGCPLSMTPAPDGDLVVMGGYASSQPISAPMVFIEKIDPELSVIRWRHTFSWPSGGSVPNPTVLADGTIVFAVNAEAVTFDTGTTVSASSDEIHTALIEMSNSGSYQWIKTYPKPPFAGGTYQITIGAVAANPGGGITIAGWFNGSVTFDFDGVAPTTSSTDDGTNSVFVAQYDAAGTFGWANAYQSSKGATLGVAGNTAFLGVAPDRSIYVAGGFDGTGVFGTTAQVGGFETQFLAHLDAKGSITAAGSWVTNPPDLPPSFALASDGSFFQTGRQSDFRRIAPATGQAVWSFPTPGWYFSRLIAATNVIVAGAFNMPTDFSFGSGQALIQPRGSTSNPYLTTFLAGYDTAGRLLWVREPNVPTNDPVTIGLDGSLYYLNALTLSFTDFDPGPGIDAMQFSNGDCVVTKFAP